MRFGRVDGIVVPADGAEPRLRLTVSLETGGRIERVRDEVVPVLRPLAGPDDLNWHADQFTQETLGIDLAERGWAGLGGDRWGRAAAARAGGAGAVGRLRRPEPEPRAASRR